MPRPLRTRKQPPAATSTIDSATAVTAKKPITKPIGAKVTKKTTRTRSATTLEMTPSEEPAPKSPVATERKKTRGSSKMLASAVLIETKTKAPPAATKARSTKSTKQTTTRSTRRRVEVTKKATTPEPAPQSPIIEVPRTPPPQKASEKNEDTTVSPPQSSNAENHAPQPMPSMTSSPPMMHLLAQSTPKVGGQLDAPTEVFEFDSDAGYTPPPQTARKDSNQRPRLADLEPGTLEPVGNIFEVGSPTPRRSKPTRQTYFPDSHSASQEPPQVGKPFFLGDDDEPFMIYSDPKSPTTPPRSRNNEVEEYFDDDTLCPPQSSSPTPRKRRSSDAGIDDQIVETTPAWAKRQKKPTRGGKKSKGSKDPAEVKTDDLRNLLPRRRKVTKQKDVFDLDTSSNDFTDDSDTDELSRPTRAAAAKRKGKSPIKPLAKSKKQASNTYSRKSDIIVDDASEATITPSDDTSTIEAGDGIVDREGRKKLKAMKAKFDEVDKWGLEFDDVSVGSLVETSDSQKR